MKKRILTLLAAALLALPVAGLAASHGMDHGSHGAMSHGAMDHGSMKMDGPMEMLPSQTVDGVSATVHIKDVKVAMGKMGMRETHHFMVNFANAKGEELVPEVAAVKIVDPAGKEREAVGLMAMQGHAGADVNLAVPGEYTFKVAAKFADGKKVRYDFVAKIK